MGLCSSDSNSSEPTKIVFLDIDGVLNKSKREATTSSLFVMEKGPLRALKRIIDATGAAIVLSSSWRSTESTRYTVNRFLESEEIPFFISCTPSIGGSERRTDEILCWLQYNTDQLQEIIIEDRDRYRFPIELPPTQYRLGKRLDITHWVAIDDMDLTKNGKNTAHIANRFVHVDGEIALTDENADLAISLLYA